MVFAVILVVPKLLTIPCAVVPELITRVVAVTLSIPAD